ncbi:hypothetical protein TNCV_4409801 [Trichonephila clavipes]|nr:hypothetical protein TNCV_4409801 [Trichonephila clavipes]
MSFVVWFHGFLYLLRPHWDGQCWLLMMLEMSSSDLLYVLTEIDPVISQGKITCQHSVRHVALQQRCEVRCVILVSTTARTSAAYAVRCPTAVNSIRRTLDHSSNIGYIPAKSFLQYCGEKFTFPCGLIT